MPFLFLGYAVVVTTVSSSLAGAATAFSGQTAAFLPQWVLLPWGKQDSGLCGKATPGTQGTLPKGLAPALLWDLSCNKFLKEIISC